MSKALQGNYLAIFASGAVLAWLVGREGAWIAALVWLVALEGVQLWRRHKALSFLREPPRDPTPALALLVNLFALTGVIRASAAVLAYAIGSTETWMLVTMMMVGTVAGTVTAVGGEPAAMRRWSMPVLGTLALGWLGQGTLFGVAVAALQIAMHFILVGYVTRIGDNGRRLIENALALERERDRVQAANLAISRLADELRTERDRVAAANEAKTRFLASASHDLRQPLYAMSLNASALSDLAARLGNAQLGRVESGMRRALVQCRSLLDQLLDIAKLEAQAVDVHWSAVDLTQLLLSMRPQYEALALDKGLAFRFDAGDVERIAWTDAGHLERLLGNLLHNAVKFTEQGEVGVRLAAPRSDGRVRIEVFDTGPGIASDEHERVFEEFYQIGNPSRDRARGLGLGLSIVRRLAALLHAEVSIDSVPGTGSSFAVELPQAKLRQPSAHVAAPDARPRGGASRSVLVIDDEVDLLEDIDSLLTLRGWSVQTARSADEARARVMGEVRPDVLLADFRLAAGATGLDAIAAVQAVVGAVPAVIVTGDTAPQRIVEAAEAGFPVLHKPIEGDALEDALYDAIERARATAA